ncbi:MAG: DNA (cytosine-5-)-methyltransferase [Candidatus Saccharimonadales bacterium]
MAKKDSKSEIRVVELFAGVGGFRIGLDRANSTKSRFVTVWNNQWEPGRTKQHASDVYVKRFGVEGHSNDDIAKVSTGSIPDHDLLVGGFPCQDYSVARTASHAEGLNGKKGVLWWQIHRILSEKGAKKPDFLMLENVDRLLKSPSSQRGRDFAIMLSSLSDLGYIVEWRVINAADYGMPQRRRRIYILGYKKGTKPYKAAKKTDPVQWLSVDGTVAKAFAVTKPEKFSEVDIEGDLPKISEDFNKNGKMSPFMTAGLMIDKKVWTFKAEPIKTKEKTLGDIIITDDSKIPDNFFITKENLKAWDYHKGAKKEERITKGGFKYSYSEGGMVFPDPLDRPSRTIVTGEGGPTPSRFKHVIKTPSGKYRRLVPVELERLNMFPDNHTEGTTDSMRAFFMGNALVIGVIEKLGESLLSELQ